MSSKQVVFMAAATDRRIAAFVARDMVARLESRFAVGFGKVLRSEAPAVSLDTLARMLLGLPDRGDAAARGEDADALRRIAEVCAKHRLTWPEIDRATPTAGQGSRSATGEN